MRFDIPVEPDGEEARRWLQDELAKPEYRAAEPTWFDRLMKAIGDWLGDLLGTGVGLPQPVVVGSIVLVVAGLIVVGLLVFGVPRLRRRARGAVALFDDGDTRDLAELRRAAAEAAARGDWALAIEERFRAIVRGLVDRELIRVHPGTTAKGAADASATTLPAFAGELAAAAALFDEVRYLGRDGSAAGYERLASLDETLWRTTPEAAAVGAAEAHAGAAVVGAPHGTGTNA
ncbi:DUF4129 domain-containing protein [Agromyces soli]